jgi:hypothetical protein
VVQVVKYLHSKHEALSSIPSTTHTEEKKGRKEKLQIYDTVLFKKQPNSWSV